MSEIRLLVVSPPCIESVNRAVYRVLASRPRLTVHMVIPDRITVEGQWKEAMRAEGEPFETTLLKGIGTHPRLRRLEGLETLVESWRPTHIIVDGDPAHMTTRQVTLAARRLNDQRPQVWVLTAENLMPDYAGDMLAGLRHGRPARAGGALLVWWLRRHARARVDRVFTLSSDGTRVMEAQGFRATKIPLGFDPALFHEQAPAKIAATRARLGLRERTFAYFGRLIPQKGLHLVLAALASMKDLPWQFLVDRFTDHGGPYVEQIRAEIASLGLGDRVVFFNASHAEMPDYVNATDFVVLASVAIPKWKEQYGRVLVEAMACGKIALGSSSGAIPEVLGDCGFIFTEGDVTALAGAMRRLLTTPEAELAPLRKKAVARAHSAFTIQRQADIWEKLARS